MLWRYHVGTGKSSVINLVSQQGDSVSVTAATGLAASAIGGQTLHRFLGIVGGDVEECCLLAQQSNTTRNRIL